MEQKNYNHDRGDREFFAQGFGQRSNCLIDKACSVIDWQNFDAFQARLDLINLLADSLDDRAGIFAEPHHDDSAYRLAAVKINRAATKIRPKLNLAQVSDTD